ncbi:hypothetical protein AB1K54_00920 [Microbacterium sp. BWT-B31]|uniref:hypothetical protein n=1 Tax=Microbacterium sp. BWT-B31 TaxID=3232072 RepID=UPI00352738E5
MRKPVAVVFATIAYVALEIAGLGMTSLLLDEDVIAASDLGPLPGVVGTCLATVVFVVGLALSLRPARASFWGALWTALATALAYVAGAGLGALLAGSGLAVAAAAAGRIVTGWFGVVVLVSAFVSAWGGIALTRTRAHRPQWPWEQQ